MPVGDINSSERGSGARFNDGKDPLQLVPVRVWREAWEPAMRNSLYGTTCRNVLRRIEAIQEGREPEPILFTTNNLSDAARVFGYGAEKYAAWNWAKGMNWSIPIGCVLRHMRSLLIDGEENDEESGLPHIGHIMCNLIMLDWFRANYPEGDDCIPSEAFCERLITQGDGDVE